MMQQLQKVQRVWNGNNRRREKGRGEILEVIMAANFPGGPENTKQIKCATIDTEAYHIQTAENQRQREYLERSQS